MIERDVLRQYNVQLIQHLPLDDESFFATARYAHLFPLDISDSIAARSTRAKKVAFFFHHVLEPRAEEYLPILLKVMKDSKVPILVTLADDMQAAMGIGL